MYIVLGLVLLIIGALIFSGITTIIDEAKAEKQRKQTKKILLRRNSNLEKVKQICFHIRENDGRVIQIKQNTSFTPPTEFSYYYKFFVDSDPSFYKNTVKIELLDSAGNIIPSEKYSIQKDIVEDAGCFFLNMN